MPRSAEPLMNSTPNIRAKFTQLLEKNGTANSTEGDSGVFRRALKHSFRFSYRYYNGSIDVFWLISDMEQSIAEWKSDDFYVR